jgi:hypothetical protein
VEREAEALAEAVVNGAGGVAVAPSPAGAPVLARRVARRLMNCQANTRGASGDPFTDLTDRDDRAGRYAARVARDLTAAADDVRVRTAATYPFGNAVQMAHFFNFGEPPARPGGFLNRLTGQVRPTLEAALAEEFRQLAARFRLVARWFNGWGVYRCINGPDLRRLCDPEYNENAQTSSPGRVTTSTPSSAAFWALSDPARGGDATRGPDQQAGI